MFEITQLDSSNEGAYEELLQVCPEAMVYHSLIYRNFLKDFLPSAAEDHYLLAFDDNQLMGAIPCFLVDGMHGIVLNSLPFFGSHGSILLRPRANPSLATALATSLINLCIDRNVSFASVIETPFSNYEKDYQQALDFQYRDERIGQITPLPKGDTRQKINEALFRLFHSKVRNQIRKGMRSGLDFGHDQTQGTMDSLRLLHQANMLRIGGIAKPDNFFASIVRQLKYEKDYRVYTARTVKKKVVCALMVLYFKDTVEYFVPATEESWRSAQPLSALINLAMCDAIAERGSHIWNWGGTWLSQTSVYHFKSRWGTVDYPYSYYTKAFPNSPSLEILSTESLVESYPWFYTLPFNILDS